MGFGYLDEEDKKVFSFRDTLPLEEPDLILDAYMRAAPGFGQGALWRSWKLQKQLYHGIRIDDVAVYTKTFFCPP